MLYLAIGFAFGVLWLAACLLWLRHEDEWRLDAGCKRELDTRDQPRVETQAVLGVGCPMALPELVQERLRHTDGRLPPIRPANRITAPTRHGSVDGTGVGITSMARVAASAFVAIAYHRCAPSPSVDIGQSAPLVAPHSAQRRSIGSFAPVRQSLSMRLTRAMRSASRLAFAWPAGLAAYASAAAHSRSICVMALSSLYAYRVGYAYSVVKRIGRVISDYLSSSGPEWTSAEREAAEARIIDIRRYRALR